MEHRSDDTKIAILAPSFPPAFLGGGPAQTLNALVRAAPATMGLSIVTPSLDLDGSPLEVTPDEWGAFQGAEVMYVSVHRAGRLVRGLLSLRRRRPEVVYINSFFNLRLSILPQLLSRLGFWRGATILLAPRGEMDAGALDIRAGKKRAFITLFKLLGLHRRVVWHASAADEARAIREVWGDSATVIVRENETSLPLTAATPTPHTGALRAMFYGRIAPKKGLLLALEALQDCSRPVVFDIFGPEEDVAYSELCRDAAARVPSNVEVTFHGPIAHARSAAVLSDHDLLLMPTSGENFGHVIAEALAGACIVMSTPHTPWTDRLEAGGGVVVASMEPARWARAIEEVAGADSQQRLGLRTRAAEQYNLWRSENKGAHVFTLLDDLRSPNNAA